MKIELWNITRIRPYDHNPRDNDGAVDAVAASLKEFGWRQPIVVDSDGVIVVGHTRWKAAVKLGLEQVPVHVANDLTPEQARAYRIADNQTASIAEWDTDLLSLELKDLESVDFDLSLLGFPEEELAHLLDGEVAAGFTDPDEIPQPPDEAITQPGDLWILGDHRLLCADSSKAEDVDRLLDGQPIHLVNSDPPYNVKVEPRSNNAIAAGLSSFAHQPKLDVGRDLCRHPGKSKPTTKKLRAKDRPLANDFVSDEQFGRLLRAWFGNMTRVLMATSPWNPDSNKFSPSWLYSASASELAALQRHLMLSSPGMFALGTSQGRWKMARHLEFLDQTLLTAIEDAQAGLLDGLVVCMPPQHGKSELISKFLPAWYLGTYPDRRVILASYEADFAAQWGRKARDLLERWGWLWGVQVARRSSAVYRWDVQGREGGMTTAGAGGAITGRGAHLLIIDDPLKNDEEARSATHRQKQWDWWQSTASTRIRPGGLFIVVQTRWHRDDLAGRILREAKTNGQRWREVKLPALAEEGDPLGRAPGEPLWPDVYNLEHFERVRSGRTNYYWRSMYQQDPIAEGGTEWPESYFGDSIWFDEFPALTEGSYRVMALDPSKGKDTKTGDYSAFVMMQVMPAERSAYIDADLEVRNIALIVDRAIDLTRTFRPNGVMIETNQFQELLAAEIARRGREIGCHLPIFHCNNHVPKIVRIRSLTQHLARGEFRFKRGSRGARLLVDQLRDFPYGDYDDGPDALEMACRLALQLVSVPPDITYSTEHWET